VAEVDETLATPSSPGENVEAAPVIPAADDTTQVGSDAPLFAPSTASPRPVLGEDATLIAPSSPTPGPALASDPTLIASPSPTPRPPLGDDATLIASPSELRRASLDAAVTGVRRHTPSHETPTRIGRYLVIERLGEGGMGVVFAAYDPQLDRKVAIKLVRPAYTETSGDEAQARLLREAQALARLRHPNIVQVYEVGAYGEEVFVAMEFIAGMTLRTWQFKHAGSWREILKVYSAAGRGLAEAHRAGLIHRDFKPDNVLVTPDGEARVLDFGLAARDDTLTAKSPDLGRGLSVNLTMPGALVGTPAYMSPEQHRGDIADVRSDVFAFSVSLFEALYGIRPFAGDTLPQICTSLFAGEITQPPPFVKIPAWVRRAVYRGLRVNPDERPQDMGTVLKALSRDPARLVVSAGVILMVAAIIGALVLALRSAEGRQTRRDEGAKVRANFDHERARSLSEQLATTRARGHESRFNAWLTAAAREQLSRDPSRALAALTRLDPDGGSWAHARAVATEAVAAGLPAKTWTVSSDEPVTALELRGRWLISGDRSGALNLRDISALADPRGDDEPLAQLQLPAAITAMSVAATGDPLTSRAPPPLRIAVIADGHLHLWDVAEDRHRSDTARRYLAVALSPDGAELATGAVDGRLRMTSWTGEERHVYPTHAAPVEQVAWADDGSLLASAGDDGVVILWNLSADTHIELPGFTGPVRDLHFDGDPSRPPTRLHATSDRHPGLAWSLDTPTPLQVKLDDIVMRRSAAQVDLSLYDRGRVSLRYERAQPRDLVHDPSIAAIALRRDGRWAALARGPRIELWDPRARRGEPLAETPQQLHTLAESADGRWIAGATQGGGLHLWDLSADPSPRHHVLRTGGPAIHEVVFVGSTLGISDDLPEVSLWSLGDAPPQARHLPIEQSTGELRLAPHGDKLLIWPQRSLADKLMLFKTDGELEWSTAINRGVSHVSLSGDGEHIVLAPMSGPAELWRVDDGELVGPPLQVGDARSRWLGFGHSEDGRSRLAAGHEPRRDNNNNNNNHNQDHDHDHDHDHDDGERGADLLVWEVDWSGIGPGALPTAHILYEEEELDLVSPDRSRSSLLLQGRPGLYLWQLDSGSIYDLPPCPAPLRDFAISDDQRSALLLGTDSVNTASQTACIVDLESGAYYRLRSHGEPWTWDGATRFGSTFGGREINLVSTSVPDERDALRTWLRDQTDRTISLDELAPPRAQL